MNDERLLKIILAPHISEKASIATEMRNEYVFEVSSDATKSEIKDAIERYFNTKVKAVRVVNSKQKTKHFKGVKGTKKRPKKAYVTLFADQKLDIMGAQ